MPERPAEDVREELLDHIAQMVVYWDREAYGSCRDRLSGLAFSILCALDGVAGLPSLLLVTDPHPDDQADAERNGEDWVPAGMEITQGVMLHEEFYSEARKALLGKGQRSTDGQAQGGSHGD